MPQSQDPYKHKDHISELSDAEEPPPDNSELDHRGRLLLINHFLVRWTARNGPFDEYKRFLNTAGFCLKMSDEKVEKSIEHFGLRSGEAKSGQRMFITQLNIINFARGLREVMGDE